MTDANDYCSRLECDKHSKAVTIEDKIEAIMECSELMIHLMEEILQELRDGTETLG